MLKGDNIPMLKIKGDNGIPMLKGDNIPMLKIKGDKLPMLKIKGDNKPINQQILHFLMYLKAYVDKTHFMKFYFYMTLYIFISHHSLFLSRMSSREIIC